MRSIIHAVDRLRVIGRLLVLSCLTSAVFGDAPPAIDAAGSFGFRATVEGDTFDVRFTRFRVQPVLDAARLPRGFDVEIDLTAIDSGDAERDAEMADTAWFAVQQYPVARFRSTRVTRGSRGGLETHGELTIKGVTRDITVPFAWQATPDALRMHGALALDRRWFGVGPDDISSVAAEVEVFFELNWTDDDR